MADAKAHIVCTHSQHACVIGDVGPEIPAGRHMTHTPVHSIPDDAVARFFEQCGITIVAKTEHAAVGHHQQYVMVLRTLERDDPGLEFL